MSHNYARPFKDNILPLLKDALNEDAKIREIGIQEFDIRSIIAVDNAIFDNIRHLLVSLTRLDEPHPTHTVISRDVFQNFPTWNRLWRTFLNKRDATVSSPAKLAFTRVQPEPTPVPPSPLLTPEISIIQPSVELDYHQPAIITIKNLTPPAGATWYLDLGLPAPPL